MKDRLSRILQTAQIPQLAELEERVWCGRYCVASDDFSSDTVGAKALNLLRLQVQSDPTFCRPVGCLI